MAQEAFTVAEVFDEEKGEDMRHPISVTEKNSDCPHFEDPGPFCSNMKHCQRDCGAKHDISEDVQALLGKEIGRFCNNFAQ